MEKQSTAGLLKASIFATLLLPTIGRAQSDTLNISQEQWQEWKEHYPRIDRVLRLNIQEENRQTYFRASELSRDLPFAGTFVKSKERYKLATSDSQGKFYRGELVDNAKKYSTYYLSELDYLILRDSKDSLYVLPETDLNRLSDMQGTNQLISRVNKLGYKAYKEGEDYYIRSKTAEIRLDAQTQKALEKNPNYITALDADQAKISALVKQAAPHTKTLDKYLSQYNIQKRNMPTASLNAWRTATTNADKLMQQINKLSKKYEGNYSFKLLGNSNQLDVFSENLLASKGVLGM